MNEKEELIKRISKKVKELNRKGEYVRPSKSSSDEINSLYGIAYSNRIPWNKILEEAEITNVWYRPLLKKLVNHYLLISFTEKNVRELTAETPGLKRMKAYVVINMLKKDKFIIKTKDGYKLTKEAVDEFKE